MNREEYLNSLVKEAKSYRLGCIKSIKRNKHMNDLNSDCVVDQDTVDAILTDFINSIAGKSCIDYGLYTKDLKK